MFYTPPAFRNGKSNFFQDKRQIPFFKTERNFLKNCFYAAVIMKWNKIDVNIRNSASCNMIKRVIVPPPPPPYPQGD